MSGLRARTRCEVIEVFPEKRAHRARFVALPFLLAQHHPQWQPGLRAFHAELIDPRRNPFWRGRTASYFLAVRAGRVVGRMGVLDPGGIRERPGAAVLIMPDFVDDAEVLAALVDAVTCRARGRGATELVGPMNPDVHHDVGIQISGFEHRNSVFMGYQPAYYAARFEALGFCPLADFQAWSLHEDHFLRDGRLRTLVERVERKPFLQIRNADVGQFDRELRIFFRLYCEAFADHWAFTAPTWEEFRFVAGDIRRVLKPGLALIAEWDGEPVGFVLSVPDFYGILPKSGGRLTPLLALRMLLRWRRMDEVRVMIAGVRPGHRGHGIHLPLFYRIACRIFELGYRGGEISWVHADNEPMKRVLPMLGARQTKTYRLFSKHLG